MSTLRADNIKSLNDFNVDVETISNQRQVDSVAALRTSTFPTSLERLWLSGYYGVGTAGGGPLYRDSADTISADNGGTVFVDAGGVRWKRQGKNAYSIMEFGAVGDGVANDRPKVSAAFDALPSGSSLHFPSGEYLFDDTEVYTNKSIYLTGDGKDITTIRKPTLGRTLRVDSESPTEFVQFGCKGIRFVVDHTLVFAEHSHIMHISGIDGALITENAFVGFKGDGIYLGSSMFYGTERHNKNVTISRNYIDGVNNDNRNGISIIDGDNITIEHNQITRTTRSNMPGAIDIEPDDHTYAVVRNIKIIGNYLWDNGGGVAEIALIRPDTITDEPFENLIVKDNFCSSRQKLFSAQAGTSTHPVKNLVISNNSGFCSRSISIMRGFYDGVVIHGNTLDQTMASLIGFGSNIVSVKNLVISDNVITAIGGECIVFAADIEHMSITGNTFDHDDTTYILQFQSDNRSWLRVNNNFFKGSGSTIGMILDNSTNASPETSMCLSNVTNVGSNNIKAFVNDMPSTFTDDTTIPSFNSSTLPSAFPYGESTVTVNGDTGVPDVGGRQGVLKCIKTYNMTKFVYQLYYPANNTGPDKVFIRKGTTTGDAWSSWYEHTGTVV